MTDAEFKELLSSVDDAYPAYVGGVMYDANKYGIVDEVANYINENKDIDAGSVIMFMHEIIFSIDPSKRPVF